VHAWESIQITIDFIEENLSEKIEIEELAKMAHLSQFYYQRLFKRLVKKSVMEYIKLRRLANAATSLIESKNRILDVGMELGFENHATFTRAFKTAYGMTPEEYRSVPVMLNHFQKPDLLLSYTLVDEDVPLIADGIVLEVTRKHLEEAETYIGITGKIPMSQVPIGETTGIDVPGQLWNDFHERKEIIPGLLPEGNELGVAYMGEADKGYFTYFTGAQAMQENTEGQEYTTWKLPAGEYVVCGFEAENFQQLVTGTLDKAHRYLFDTWLKNHQLITQPFAAEKYFETIPETNYMEIWVIPVSIDQTERQG